jgi:riboflavin kinase
VKPILWPTLYRLAELGAIQGAVTASTTALAMSLNISQQTISRHLIELERQGLITRQSSLNGAEIKITGEGVKELQGVYLTLKRVFEESRQIALTFTGRVFTGLGEGAYYVDQPGYRRHFQRSLGFRPYPGTLNLRLPPSQIGMKKELEAYSGIGIKGFEVGGRSFGGVRCYRATINGVEGAVILIGRTHYDDSVLELIAPVHLRSRLNLKDGSKVKVVVQVEGDREGTTTQTTSPR